MWWRAPLPQITRIYLISATLFFLLLFFQWWDPFQNDPLLFLSSSSSISAHGGGAYFTGVAVTMTSNHFSENEGLISGVEFQATKQVTLASNTAENEAGSQGIFGFNSIQGDASLTLGTFTDNEGVSVTVLGTCAGRVFVTNSEFTGNHGEATSAILVVQSSYQGNITMDNNQYSENSFISSAMFMAAGSGRLVISGSTVSLVCFIDKFRCGCTLDPSLFSLIVRRQ